MEQIGYHNEHTTVLERIFPWTQSGATIRVSNKPSYNKLMKDQTNARGPTLSTISQTVLKRPDMPQLNKEELIVNKEEPIVNKEKLIVNNKQKFTLSNDQKATSVFEMWNLIESVGIKRNMLNKIFTTDEATSELYHVIENRIHYEREQEMINRLRSHVAKLNESNKMKKEVIKEAKI
ncbi:MAG TPA: hypothetical protein VEU72_05215 [Nitrosopumilaceae archaeon]|nr:hypothetical protein [Nitrosopumilaceae archaeon]